MKTAFLFDGGFFVRRHLSLCGELPAAEVAKKVEWICHEHLKRVGRTPEHLYRILFYDCPPLSKKVHHPITKRAIDFSKTSVYRWRTEFHIELKRLRKLALRFGTLTEKSGHWAVRPERLKELLSGKITVADLQPDDVFFDVGQKGVDMKLGLDIAAVASKRLADQIVLVSGDSDFVPAAKVARREGIDFILNPMHASITPDLFEHIDGLQHVVSAPEQTPPA